MKKQLLIASDHNGKNLKEFIIKKFENKIELSVYQIDKIFNIPELIK